MGSKLSLQGKKKKKKSSLSKGPVIGSGKTFFPGLSLPKILHPSHYKINKHFPSGSLA